MLPRTPAGVARIAYSGELYGEPWACVFHVHFDTFAAATAADLISFTDSMAGNFNTIFMAHLDNQCTFEHNDTQLFLAAPDVLRVERTYAYVGGVTTDAESNQACYVLSWGIAASYRGGKPRTYLPGVTESGTVNHREVEATMRTALATGGATWMTDIAGAGGASLSNPRLGTVSYRTGNAPRAVALFRQYTGCTVHPRLGTQRRRLGKWRP